MQDHIIEVQRIAYRADSSAIWQWYGPAIPITIIGFPRWLDANRMIEEQCDTLVKNYQSIEDYQHNVKLVVAPSMDAIERVELNEQEGDIHHDRIARRLHL